MENIKKYRTFPDFIYAENKKYAKKGLKSSNLDAFFRPSTLKTDLFKKKLRVGYVYIEESYHFQYGLWGGGLQEPPMPYGSEK